MLVLYRCENPNPGWCVNPFSHDSLVIHDAGARLQSRTSTSTNHRSDPLPFADALTAAIREKRSPVCVGFDPLINRLPPDIAQSLASGNDELPTSAEVASAIETFGRGVIDAVAEFVPAVKINIAFFEPLYAAGIHAYHNLVAHARDQGLLVIGDVKRADIGHTTAQYADAQLGTNAPFIADAPALPDAVTVNPYFGLDGVAPFIDRCKSLGRGLFILVQTSNESAAAVQGLNLDSGELVSDRVAQLVNEWSDNAALIGSSGYSNVGAVVSPRDLESTRRIRSLMPRSIFLVPGFGAQGRTASEVAECFKPDGTGAIVNASRSVIYAFQNAGSSESTDWKSDIARACKEFIDLVRTAVPA